MRRPTAPAATTMVPTIPTTRRRAIGILGVPVPAVAPVAESGTTALASITTTRRASAAAASTVLLPATAVLAILPTTRRRLRGVG